MNSFGEIYRERVTISAFVLQGAELKADVKFDGPIGGDGEDSQEVKITGSSSFREALLQFDRGYGRHGNRKRQIRFKDQLDFDHLNILEEEEEEMEEEESDEYDREDEEETMRRLAAKRRKTLEQNYRKKRNANKQELRIRLEGDEYMKTFKVESAGLYRYCVVATSSQVVLEIDLRKESELGGVNEETGHVWTFDEKSYAEEDVIMKEDTADEEGIKDEDFTKTKSMLQTLRKLQADVLAKQQEERRRLAMFTSAAEHSHSRMVLGSLLETIVFMVVTGVQIMTVRRWFKAAPMLGT